MRVSKAELGQFAEDDTIVKLTDGSGYYSTVTVFHGLHCVNRLHHYLYPDHYYPDLDKDEQFLLKRHTGTSRTLNEPQCALLHEVLILG